MLKRLAELPSKCKVLGIEYKPELEDDMDEIENAVELKEICDKCQYIAETCKACKYGESVCRNKYLSCDMYAAYQKEETKRSCAITYARKSGLGIRFRDKTFENFNVTDKTEKAYNACKGYADSYKEGVTNKGLKLFGSYGCGKTHLVSAIIHRLGESCYESAFINVPELFIEIKQSFGNEEKNACRLVERAKKSPLLILDDLGAEKPSDWVREQLYVIVNRRYEDMLPTIVTTNCTTQDLVNRLGERTVSRLVEMTDAYKIMAPDYRLKKG
jgi:DNA replication protein DnaC